MLHDAKRQFESGAFAQVLIINSNPNTAPTRCGENRGCHVCGLYGESLHARRLERNKNTWKRFRGGLADAFLLRELAGGAKGGLCGSG